MSWSPDSRKIRLAKYIAYTVLQRAMTVHTPFNITTLTGPDLWIFSGGGGGAVEPWNVQTTTFVQTFRPQMCKQPHLCKHFGLKCANNHICANISASNVQTTTFVQTFRPQMCKQPHLCKHGTLKCANLYF